MSPLDVVILAWDISCSFAWIASLLTKDYSWVDREWSIVPVLYVWIFAIASHVHNVRLDVMAVLVTLWGARLTFNFARKGGYSGEEDYRWAVLRSRMSPRQFQVFNFFFIVLYQNALLVLITLPAWTAYQHRHNSFGIFDGLLSVLFLACLCAETIADQQQWNFHQTKKRLLEAGSEPSPPFCTTGLFALSRHPNFFFEQAQWWLLFFLGATAARSILQWTVLGAVLLSLLFLGSTRFTEEISLSKYPSYADYQRSVSQQIPWFPKRRHSAIR